MSNDSAPILDGGGATHPPSQVWPDGGIKTFDKCPHCKSTVQLYDVAANGEPTSLPQNTKAFLTRFLDFDTVLGPKRVTVFENVCPMCGTIYAFRMMKQRVVPQMPKEQNARLIRHI